MMIVGVLKEIKAEENRVSMTPSGVEVMIENGHKVLVEKNAGKGSGYTDRTYEKSGAEIVDTPEDIFKRAKMVMHVKEPLPSEYDLIRKEQIVFTYLHLAAAEELTRVLMKSGSICIAYETIQKEDGTLPLLTPMSAPAEWRSSRAPNTLKWPRVAMGCFSAVWSVPMPQKWPAV